MIVYSVMNTPTDYTHASQNTGYRREVMGKYLQAHLLVTSILIMTLDVVVCYARALTYSERWLPAWIKCFYPGTQIAEQQADDDDIGLAVSVSY